MAERNALRFRAALLGPCPDGSWRGVVEGLTVSIAPPGAGTMARGTAQRKLRLVADVSMPDVDLAATLLDIALLLLEDPARDATRVS